MTIFTRSQHLGDRGRTEAEGGLSCMQGSSQSGLLQILHLPSQSSQLTTKQALPHFISIDES